MCIFNRLLRWLLGKPAQHAQKSELKQTSQKLQETLDRNKLGQHQIILTIDHDRRWSKRAVNTAQEALKVAKEARSNADDKEICAEVGDA